MNSLLSMKKFALLLLVIVCFVLVSGSVEHIAADHLQPDHNNPTFTIDNLIGIFKDGNLGKFNLVPAKNTEYQIHVQVEVRNIQGELISISESDYGFYIPHGLTYQTFDEKMGEKETIIIDNKKYEKIQYAGIVDTTQALNNYQGLWRIQICENIVGYGFECIPVYQINTAPVSLTEEDITTIQWTILRSIG